MRFVYNDGGRKNYFRAKCVGDCATRALAISTGRDYKECYNIMKRFNHGTPRNGVSRKAIFEMMKSLGYRRVNCEKKSVRISDFEKRGGVYYILLTGHATTVAYGTLLDTWDCSKHPKQDKKVIAYWKVG